MQHIHVPSFSDMQLLIIIVFLSCWVSGWSQNVQFICPSLTLYNNSTNGCIQISNISTDDFRSNSSFVFLPGNHVLISDLRIENINNFTMIGSKETVLNEVKAVNGYKNTANSIISFSMSTSIINCGSLAGIIFLNITNLSLINITLVDCGEVYNRPAMRMVNINNVLLHGVTLVNSSIVGLFGHNVSGDSTVIDSVFVGSRFGIILVQSSVSIFNSRFGNSNRAVTVDGSDVQCWGCLFVYNYFGFVAGILPELRLGSHPSYSHIALFDSSFTNCMHGVHLNYSVASVFNGEYVTNRVSAYIFNSITDIVNSTFTDGYVGLLLFNTSAMLSNVSLSRNQNSGIRARSSRLSLTGNVSVNDCYLTNGYGGALFLLNTVVYITAPATVVFSNNTAVMGGAVYVAETPAPSSTVRACFIQVNDSYGNIINPAVQIVFINNTAVKGGSALYANVITCTLEQSPSLNYNEIDPMKVFKAISAGITYSNEPNIQYEPVNVVFCQVGQNSALNKEISIYPGYAGQVGIAAVDIYNNSVYATVFTQTNDILRLDITSTNTSCQQYDLPDYVTNSNYSTVLYFGIDSFDYRILGWDTSNEKPMTKVTVLKVLPCPPGFAYEGNACGCTDYLSGKKIVCDISKQSFSTSSTEATWWLGPRYSNDTKLFYSPNCPLEYCKLNHTKISAMNFDMQCNFNRSSVLCGKCAEGLSETFGEPKCSKCDDNRYVAYLTLYAVLGIALVVIIFALDLTVSAGTINELVFYANVININGSTMFPSAITIYPFIKFLYVFIAWLNLDLGLELCFYDGMDNYQKAWLQFGFPLYLLVIVGAIVVVSRCSRRMAALCGRNVVPVLATIIRLSYTKVVRNVVGIFEATDLYDVDTGSPYNVWLYDGSIQYMGTIHLILCIFGIIVAVGFIIPYTTVILFSPWLQKYSHLKILCWVHKMTPYIDSYQAPYKDRYRFWTGFLLVIRIFLSAMALSFPSNPLNLMLMLGMVLTAILTVFLALHVYKNKYHLILGSFFYVNMIFICFMMIYIQGNQNNINRTLVQVVFIGVGVGSAFCCFVGILIFHGFKKLSKQFGATYLSQKKPTAERVEFELASASHEKYLADKENNCELRESLLI